MFEMLIFKILTMLSAKYYKYQECPYCQQKAAI